MSALLHHRTVLTRECREFEGRKRARAVGSHWSLRFSRRLSGEPAPWSGLSLQVSHLSWTSAASPEAQVSRTVAARCTARRGGPNPAMEIVDHRSGPLAHW